MEIHMPMLLAKADQHLILLGYKQGKDSIYYKGEGSLGIRLSWCSSDGTEIDIQFFSENSNGGKSIKVDSLKLATSMIDNFDFVNRLYIDRVSFLSTLRFLKKRKRYFI